MQGRIVAGKVLGHLLRDALLPLGRTTIYERKNQCASAIEPVVIVARQVGDIGQTLSQSSVICRSTSDTAPSLL